jgi:hypothetical protein
MPKKLNWKALFIIEITFKYFISINKVILKNFIEFNTQKFNTTGGALTLIKFNTQKKFF